MLSNADINALLAQATPADAMLLMELRQATVPLQVSLSPEMATALGSTYRRLTPFLGIVADVISSKLEIDDQAIKLRKVGDTNAVRGWLGDDSFGVAERELWFALVRDGCGYLLTMWDDDTGMPCYTAIAQYLAGAGAFITADGVGVHAWQSPDGACLDVYEDDRIETYIRGRAEKDEWVARYESADAWPIDWTDQDGMPLGCALTKFEIDESDLASALQIGRDMNEALLDMLAASRTQGWPQRYISGGGKAADLLTNPLGQPFVTSGGRPMRRTVNLTPGSIIPLAEGQALGQLAATTADATLIDQLLVVLGFLTTVPTHYFSGSWPSGVALIQSESRLNHLVEEHQGRLSSPAVAVVRLTIRLSNTFGEDATIDAAQAITIPWHAPQILTEDLLREREQHQQDSVATLVEKGLMSKMSALRALHPDWKDEQIAAELALLAAERPATGEARPILGYHIEQGVVSKNESRAELGLPAVDESSDARTRQLQTALALVKAATEAHIDLPNALALAGLALPVAGMAQPMMPAAADQVAP